MEEAGKLFESELVVGNLGSSLFADSVRMQGKQVVGIDWEVPCGGNEKLNSMLAGLRSAGGAIDEANSKALEIINASHPFIAGIGTAI